MIRSGELHVMKEIAKKELEKNSGSTPFKCWHIYIIVWIFKARFEIGPNVLQKHFTS